MPVPAIFGQPFTLYAYLTSQANPNIFQVNPTITVVDVLVSVDGSAFSPVITPPAVTDPLGPQVQIDLTGAEVGNVTAVWCHDVVGNQWKDETYTFSSDSRAIGDLALEGADGDTLETLSDQLDLVALTGGDGDTLETLSDQLDAVAIPGDLMGLVDDAITLAKFDEVTAFPLEDADAGPTYVARTGADADTLETLSDQLDDVCTLGTGIFTWTYTLMSAVAPFGPIADADVWVTTDVGGLNVIAAGKTNAFGVVTFYLDPGPIFVWSQKSGWNFVNPDAEVVP